MADGVPEVSPYAPSEERSEDEELNQDKRGRGRKDSDSDMVTESEDEDVSDWVSDYKTPWEPLHQDVEESLSLT